VLNAAANPQLSRFDSSAVSGLGLEADDWQSACVSASVISDSFFPVGYPLAVEPPLVLAVPALLQPFAIAVKDKPNTKADVTEENELRVFFIEVVSRADVISVECGWTRKRANVFNRVLNF
jgi:hypothetical protein